MSSSTSWQCHATPKLWLKLSLSIRKLLRLFLLEDPVCIGRSNRGHHPSSPNDAPATTNRTCLCIEKMLQQETVPDTVVEMIIINVQRKIPDQTPKKRQKAAQSVYKVLRRAPKCITVQQTTTPYHKVRQSTPPFYKVPACTTKNYTLTTVSMSHAVLQSIIEYTLRNQLLIRIAASLSQHTKRPVYICIGRGNRGHHPSPPNNVAATKKWLWWRIVSLNEKSSTLPEHEESSEKPRQILHLRPKRLAWLIFVCSIARRTASAEPPSTTRGTSGVVLLTAPSLAPAMKMAPMMISNETPSTTHEAYITSPNSAPATNTASGDPGDSSLSHMNTQRNAQKRRGYFPTPANAALAVSLLVLWTTKHWKNSDSRLFYIWRARILFL